MKAKILSILAVLSITAGACASSKKVQELSLSELSSLYDRHTTSHMVYCGSDSEYHYFIKAVVLTRDRKYKLNRANLLIYGEFMVDESKSVLFSPPMNGAIYIEGYKR